MHDTMTKMHETLKELQWKRNTMELELKQLQTSIQNIDNKIVDIQHQMQFVYQDYLLDAIILGLDFKVSYGVIVTPHVYGYKLDSNLIVNHLCATISTHYEWWLDLPEKLYHHLVHINQWNSSTFERFIQKTNRRWLNLPATCKHKTETSLHVPIATGYEITDDSCIFTTYPSNYRADATLEANSIRTAQIQLAQELMVLKGFAVDFYLENRQHFRIPLELVEQVYRRHGLLDEHESLDETWCKRNPSRCIL